MKRGSSWTKQKARFDLLALRLPKETTLMSDAQDIAKAMSRRKKVWPVQVAKQALSAFVYSWKRDHGLEIPPIKLKTHGPF